MTNLYLIDGTFELFRAYYAMPSILSPSGIEVGATRGYMSSLVKFLRDHRITHCGVAFDYTIESFRNKLFDGYKTGEGIEPDLWRQFRFVEQGTAALGLTIWPMKKFEADDALAAAAHKFGKQKSIKKIIIATPDKDLCQMVKGSKVVTYDRIRMTYLDETGVKKKFGVGPASIPDFLALTGDPADGIPGIPRWGAKSAAAVLKVYKHIENIPLDESKWKCQVRGAAALGKNFRSMQKEVKLYKCLATLRTDVPIKGTLSALKWRGPSPSKLRRFCKEVGDKRLLQLL